MISKLSMVMIDLEPNWSWSKQKQAQETLLRLDGFGWNSVICVKIVLQRL